MDASLEALREEDRRAYLSVLLAPANGRSDLAALWRYAHQLATIPFAVTEPAAGEIRLQWWADVVRGEREEEGRGHPVGAALLDAIARHELPRDPLAEMAEARSFDLYADPMPSRGAFEAYAGSIASVPIQTACLMLDREAAARSTEAAGHAGVYQVAIDRIASIGRDRAAGRSFLPADVLLEAWVAPTDIVRADFADDAGRAGAVIERALAYARTHRTAYGNAIADLPPTLAPAFAAAQARTVVEGAISRMGAAVLNEPPPPRPVREQRTILGTARAFGRGRRTGLLGRLRELLDRGKG